MTSSSLTFREVVEDDAELILKWRSKKRITEFMVSDLNDDLESQKKWLLDCYNREDYYHWIIVSKNNPIGLINLKNFNRLKKITSWGWYIGEDGLVSYGALIPPFFYNWAFMNLGVKEIVAPVLENNVNVIKLHLSSGYKFNPDKNETVKKNGKEISLIYMSLKKEDWNFSKWDKFTSNFPISKWKFAPE